MSRADPTQYFHVDTNEEILSTSALYTTKMCYHVNHTFVNKYTKLVLFLTVVFVFVIAFVLFFVL